MSRIHEALKKAEEDRAAGRAGADAIIEAVAEVRQPDVTSKSTTTYVASAANTGLPASGVGPQLVNDSILSSCAHPQWQPDMNMSVFGNAPQNGHGAEQFRTLRSRLYQLRSTRPLQTLLVTSSVPAEGKTFVAANLAQAIVHQPDRRAIIIDADLRCSRLHLRLGAPLAPGLSDYLRGEANELSVIQHGQQGNLWFIPGGREVANPSELLSNPRLKTLIDRLKSLFDWIILDSAPSLGITDTSILADVCEGVLMVVRAGSTPSDVARRACREFHERNLLGVVLNCVSKSDGYGPSGYYYGYNYSRPDS